MFYRMQILLHHPCGVIEEEGGAFYVTDLEEWKASSTEDDLKVDRLIFIACLFLEYAEGAVACSGLLPQ